MTTLTPVAAAGIINIGMEIGQFPPGAMPESDKDKVEEAGKLVQLVIQNKRVADAIGPNNVPLYPKIIEVLQLAGIDPNATDQPAAAPAAPPTAAPPVETTPPVAPAAEPAPVAAAPQPPAPVQAPPPAAASPAEDTPRTGETWLDADNNGWVVLHGDGGLQVEIESMVNGQKTVIPGGFLKQRISAAAPTIQQDPSPEPVPSPPPTPSPAPSSAPPSPPSPSPVPTPLPTEAPVVVAPEPPPSAPSGAESPAPSSPPLLPAPPSSTSSGEESASDREPMFPIPIDDDEGDEQYGNLLAQVNDDYTPSGMPTPMDLERPPTEMPDDLTSIGDIEQRRLHSQFNALASRARYLQGIEAAKARACGRVKDNYLKQPMRDARKELGSGASVGEVRGLAEENSEVVQTWTTREQRHADRAEAYGTFRSFYSTDVEVLSRDWTMRDQEQKGS